MTIVTVKDVLQANDSIRSVLDNVNITNLKLKFQLLSLLKQFEPIVENYVKVRNDKLQELGDFDEAGERVGLFRPARENFDSDETFNAAISEYNSKVSQFDSALFEVESTEITSVFDKIKFADIADSGLSTNILLALYNFIEE